MPFAVSPQDLHALAFGFLSGALILMTGLGAGVIVVPGLIALFGLPASLAIGTASAFSVLTKIMAGASHVRAGNFSKKMFLGFARLALPATLLVALLVNGLLALFPGQGSAIQLGLKLAVIVAAACATALMLLPGAHQLMRGASPWFFPVVSGSLIGATGVGGGVLIVPALVAIRTESFKRIVGTSVILGLLLSAVTGLVYSASGAVAWRTALVMALGALLAMPLAGRLFKQASDTQVRLLSILLIVTSITAMVIDIGTTN